ncbi:hypothetical protein GOBAR_AA27213 [Gossypium barbadense]|uniref:beta-ketoacyl-[acyl-carrier-protein] synthase I n=1 Tax=Gossypium barbadense TaxID=3634 RepID=A0A2P5WQW9_GOSBA|nr:hypothetical protein GOBAR_AA27213 [Gossypium barbadense]
MASSSSLVSPLCNQSQSPLLHWVADRRKAFISSPCNGGSATSKDGGAFEPCNEYYSSKNGSFSSFFGSKNVSFNINHKHPRLNRGVARSGQAMAVAVEPVREIMTKQKPPTKQRRVVVTGMGVVTPLGHDPDVFYNNLLEGASGISEIEAFDCAQFPTRIAGEIKSLSADGWIAPKLSKRMDKFMLYMLIAGKKALEDGGVTEDVMEELDKEKCGVLIGSAMGGMKVFNDAIEALRISYRKMNPFCVPFATTNMGSAMLAMDLGWMGPNYSISTACATSNFCILNAANHMIRGEADMMLCGGSDAAIIPIVFSKSQLFISHKFSVRFMSFGHLLGAAGAVEAIAAVQAIRTGWVHPNINLENPDQEVDTNVLVGPKKERLNVKAALSNSFGFGGHNSSIIFAPYKKSVNIGQLHRAEDSRNLVYRQTPVRKKGYHREKDDV